MGEKLGADVAHGALGHVDHDAGVGPGGQDAHQVDAGDAAQRAQQGPKVGVLLLEHGGDVIVDQGLEEKAGLDVGKSAEEDADQHHQAVGGVVLEHFAQDALDEFAGVGHFGPGAPHGTPAAGAADGAHVLFSHQDSPPCLSKSPPPWVWLL